MSPSRSYGLSWLRSLLPVLVAPVLALPALARQQILHQVGGNQVGDQLGRDVSKAGDVNADGFADFMAGGFPSDRNGTTNGGLVEVFSGQDGSEIYVYVGADGSNLGASVSDAGDVDGDGYGDFIMGAWGEDVLVGIVLKATAGTADVRSGIDGSRLFRFKGQDSGVGLGYCVSGAGDVNADGYPDLAIGSVGGSVWIRSGRNGQLISFYSGDDAQTRMRVVSGAGDVNGDGFDDVVGGDESYQTSKGIVRVFSGQSGQQLYSWAGAADFERFGVSAADAGDVDADGFADVIAGKVSNWPGTPGSYAHVYSGKDGSLVHLFDEGSASSDLGFSVAGAGDIDNDGHDDLVCGEPTGDYAPGVVEGRVWVYSGRTGALLFTLDAGDLVRYLGESVDGAGDVDGDGYGDIIAGAGPSSYLVTQGGYAVVATGAECGSIRSYASECSGGGGFAPALALTGCLVAGNPLELSLTNGPGGAPAALIISMTSATSPLGSGCLFHVGFPAMVIPLGALSGTGPGEGTWSTSAAVPPLPGATLFLAALIQDGTQRLASNTLEATIAP